MQTALSTKTASAIATPQDRGGYVSPLEKIQSYAELWQIGEMFASSQLVPDTFRGKPADCVIALDLALRLDLNPLSLFPQLYVIHGRPSLSAQYMIALVNRSGQFSHIRWEEGIDGEIEFELYGKTRKAPNYYAVAMFTEKATGETLRSTRIDCNLAKANGWFSKDGSKWRTMPQQMCRYRAASWLIKSYAPELAMGLSFADEAEDSPETFGAETPSPVVIQPAKPLAEPIQSAPTTEVEPETDDEPVALSFEKIKKAFAEAKTVEELKTIPVDPQTLERYELDELRRLYRERLEELKSADAQAPAADPQAVEPPKKKRTTKKAASVEAQKPLVEQTPADGPASGDEKLLELEIGTKIEETATEEGLDALVNRVLDEVNAERLGGAAKERLVLKLREKYAQVKGTPFDDAPTEQGASYADNLKESMTQSAEANNLALLKTQARCADLWFVQGFICSSQRADLLNKFRQLARPFETEPTPAS